MAVAGHVIEARPAGLGHTAPALPVLHRCCMPCAMSARPTKITFGEMRDMGVRGLLVYCADYRYSHSIAISGDGWP